MKHMIHNLRIALFWAIMQCMQCAAVIPYWHSGTTYRSHLQGSRNLSNSQEECCYPLLCSTRLKSHTNS